MGHSPEYVTLTLTPEQVEDIRAGLSGNVEYGRQEADRIAQAPDSDGYIDEDVEGAEETAQNDVRIAAMFEAALQRATATTPAFVLVVRSPDYANEFTIDGAVTTVDVDLGSHFIDKPGDEETAVSFAENLQGWLVNVPTSSPVFTQTVETVSEAVGDFPAAVEAIETYLDSRGVKH